MQFAPHDALMLEDCCGTEYDDMVPQAELVLGDPGDANVDSILFDSIHCCYVSRSFID